MDVRLSPAASGPWPGIRSKRVSTDRDGHHSLAELPQSSLESEIAAVRAIAPEPWHLKILVVEDDASDFHWTKTTLEGMEEYEVSITHAPRSKPPAV